MAKYAPIRPMGNPFIVGFASAPVLTPEEASELAVSLADADDGDPCPDSVMARLDRLFAAAVEASNSQHFRFDLTSLHGDEAATVTRLRSGTSLPGLDAEHSTRKLTAVLPLSADVDRAAAVVFPALEKSGSLTPGVMGVFPSYLAHEFSLDAGVELIGIVTFAVGPAFR